LLKTQNRANAVVFAARERSRPFDEDVAELANIVENSLARTDRPAPHLRSVPRSNRCAEEFTPTIRARKAITEYGILPIGMIRYWKLFDVYKPNCIYIIILVLVATNSYKEILVINRKH
jgi:hypothetical protein